MKNVEAQDRVVDLTNSITATLAGVDIAEAHTALSLAVAATICGLAPNDPVARQQASEAFTRQVRDLIQRTDIAEWIEAATIHIPRAGHA